MPDVRYDVLAESFPVLTFFIQLDVSGDAQTTQAHLIDG